LLTFTQKLCDLADYLEGKSDSKTESSMSSFKKKKKVKKGKNHKNPMRTFDAPKQAGDKGRREAPKELSPEMHLETSFQRGLLKAFSEKGGLTYAKANELEMNGFPNAHSSIKKEHELKLNLSLCPTFSNQTNGLYNYAKTERDRTKSSCCLTDNFDGEVKSTSKPKKKLKKLRKTKLRLMTSRNNNKFEDRKLSKLSMYQINHLDSLVKSLSQIGSHDNSSSDKLSSPYFKPSE